MSSESQADAIRQIEQALLALRGGRRHGPHRDHGHGGNGQGDSGHDEHGHGAGGRGMVRPPWAGRRTPPWGDGPPPWAGGHHAQAVLAGAARFRLLEALLASSPMSVSDVAAAVGVDQPRASRLVNDAAERGLVARSVDPRDARRSVIELTEAGRTLLESARASRRSAVTEALADFTPDETQTLAALLARFAAAWPAPPQR